MNYFLKESELSIQKLFRDYVNKRIIPSRFELDQKNEFPDKHFEEMAVLDFFRVMVPEEYGGFGDNIMQLTIAIEELSRGDGGIGVSFAVDSIATKALILFGSKQQKTKYLPSIADGKILTGFALTEPNAGSDAGSIKTRAVPKNGSYVINGVKQFITNGEVASLYVVLAVTDSEKGKKGGHTAFLVEKGTPGISFGKKEDKMGIRSSVTREVIFEDCVVPEENILGNLGQGFYIAMNLLDKSRIGIGAQAIGIAEAALEEACKYAKQRKQFGQSIHSFQGIQFILADMATAIEAARLLVYQAAKLADSGSDVPLTKIASMSKLFASDTAVKVTNDALQVFGGYGYMKEYPMEKFVRDARVTQIYEGTNQIQRLAIANSLIKEPFF
ncbi:MAG: acyl-CoA dehydrogenase family protein [Leptospiraceae bacterium]|nr:acyl-CoA dehydrogenase family protein [Leptospiraceae bacterium]MCP5496674.1 acyl-CoA dehydrogenase family protein [Leptospiraceae bacterium]